VRIPSIFADLETELDRIVSRFERAWQTREKPVLDDFLPPPDHPHFEAILCELIRVDLEMCWMRNCPQRLTDYRARHPGLFRNAVMLNLLTFEEFRQRVLAGEAVDPNEYENDFGIYTGNWPRPPARAVSSTVPQIG
jgi:hypothetical protein